MHSWVNWTIISSFKHRLTDELFLCFTFILLHTDNCLHGTLTPAVSSLQSLIFTINFDASERLVIKIGTQARDIIQSSELARHHQTHTIIFQIAHHIISTEIISFTRQNYTFY